MKKLFISMLAALMIAAAVPLMSFAEEIDIPTENPDAYIDTCEHVGNPKVEGF